MAHFYFIADAITPSEKSASFQEITLSDAIVYCTAALERSRDFLLEGRRLSKKSFNHLFQSIFVRVWFGRSHWRQKGDRL
jgi:hypothetical protein